MKIINKYFLIPFLSLFCFLVPFLLSLVFSNENIVYISMLIVLLVILLLQNTIKGQIVKLKYFDVKYKETDLYKKKRALMNSIWIIFLIDLLILIVYSIITN